MRIDLKKYNIRTIGVVSESQKDKPNLKDDHEIKSENYELLQVLNNDWESLREWREERNDNLKYRMGDQWFKQVTDDDGNLVTEETYIKDSGRLPLKQNYISKLIRNILGQYRSNPTESIVVARDREEAKGSEMLSAALDYASYINDIEEIDARQLEEFAISGAIVSKTSYKYQVKYNRYDVFHEIINPNRIFFNYDLEDIRMLDLIRIGQIIDASIDEVIEAFAKDEKDEKKIREWYGKLDDQLEPEAVGMEAFDQERFENIDFLNAQDPTKCRVIECWYFSGEWILEVHDPFEGELQEWDIKDKKEFEAKNEELLKMAVEQGVPAEDIMFYQFEKKYKRKWYFKYLTPWGHTLMEGESPFLHNEHPFTVVLHPLIDGHVHGVVYDVIDQQRYINRLISLYDFILGSSAKGVLMVPEDAVPDNMSPEDFASEYTKVNGVLFYKASLKHGHVPREVSSKSVNPGINDLLKMQIQMVYDLSGVSEAIQGQEPKSGTPSSLYAQQAKNSSLNIKDMFETFSWYKEQRDRKMLKVIAQYYKDVRYLNIVGKNYSEEAKNYDPSIVQDMEFDNAVTQSFETPVYRQIMDDTLMDLLKTGLIDISLFLEHSNLPFADKLLESIKSRQQGQEGDIPPEVLEQMAQSGDPQAQALLTQAMG